MTTAPSTIIQQLCLKSTQANGIIGKLQEQIKQIRAQTTPQAIKARASALTEENAKLKVQVETLKKELEIVEAKKTSNKEGAVAATGAATPASVTKNDNKNQHNQNQKQKQKQQEPAAKKERTPKKKKEEPMPEVIDYSLLDMRVGKILTCEKHPDADSLYVESIDFGEDKPRQICSGLVKFVPLEAMQNRMCVALLNLKPSKLRGVMSEGMVMCASTAEKVEVLLPPAGAAIGDRVTVAGCDGAIWPELNQKNNLFGLVAPYLACDANKVAGYKGTPMEVKGKGSVKSETLTDVPVK